MPIISHDVGPVTVETAEIYSADRQSAAGPRRVPARAPGTVRPGPTGPSPAGMRACFRFVDRSTGLSRPAHRRVFAACAGTLSVVASVGAQQAPRVAAQHEPRVAAQQEAPSRQASTVPSGRASGVAFVDVNLVPLGADTVVAHTTVVVRDGRVAAVGPAGKVRVPAGVVTVDGRGKFLMPGLVDMHVHLFNSRDLLLYLANGVTTIRNLGAYAAADSILRLRSEVESGRRLGPTIFTSGNWLDGDPPIRSINTVVRTPEEARAVVTRQKEAGYDFIKVYEMLSPEVYAEIVRTGRRLGIAVTGHVPSAVGVDAVLASGQAGVDHASSLMRGDPADIARRARQARLGVTTTLVMLHRSFAMFGSPEVVESLLALPEARFISPETRTFWRNAPYFGYPKTDPMPVYAGAERLVKALVAEGVQVMAGTDAGIWGNEPGYSEVEEVARLAAAGLTPYEALRAATVVPADFLNRWVKGADQPGVIRQGNRADFVLLEANPLRNVTVLGRRAGVMVRGKWLPQVELDRMLEELAAEYSRADSTAHSR